MKFVIEKWAMLIMKSSKRHRTEGIKLLNQEKVRTDRENETAIWFGWVLWHFVPEY